MKINIIKRTLDYIQNLGVKTISTIKTSIAKMVVAKNASNTRHTVNNWITAQKAALRADKPRRTKLADLYIDIMREPHLSSQINLRTSFTKSADFTIYKDGEPDDELTKMVKNSLWFKKIADSMLDTIFWGHSLIELSYEEDRLIVSPIPYANVEPRDGLFYPDTSLDKNIKYREVKEYGKWILEFGDRQELGLLCKCVPYCLFKRFATNSWMQLIELFGIPPRILKTDTTDDNRLKQAEAMMTNSASAQWMIIDNDEMIEWGTAISSNGEIYDTFVSRMKEEISLIIVGAQLGQDTINGNMSKESSSQDLLAGIVANDKQMLQNQFNAIVIPALESLGVLPTGCEFVYAKEVDLTKLWSMVQGGINTFNYDIDWLNKTFGLQITGIKEGNTPQTPTVPGEKTNQNLNLDRFFI